MLNARRVEITRQRAVDARRELGRTDTTVCTGFDSEQQKAEE